MEGKVFAKMTKDCGFFDKNFSNTHTDIVFAKAKSKAERRLDFK